MHRFVLTLLFVALIVSLNRDETWFLPRLSDQNLTEADLEEIIARGLPVPLIVELPPCNCDPPLTPLKSISEAEPTTRPISEADDCDCASDLNVYWCGTPFLQAEAAIREAMEAGLHPFAIAQLIEQYCGLLGTCKFGL